MARNLRNSPLAGGGFFAFQDIITTVIAFMLLIILYLMASTRGMLNVSVPSASAGARPELTRELEDKLAQITALEDKLTGKIQESKDGTIQGGKMTLEDIAVLESRVVAVKTQLDRYKRQASDLTEGQDTPANKAAAAAAIVESDLKDQVTATQTEAKKAQTKREEAERKVRDLDAAIARALAENQKIWVIPDRSRTTKTPVFGVLSSQGIAWALYGKQAVVTSTSTANLPDQLGKDMNSYKKEDYYIVLYLKPSGIKYFEATCEKIKSLGYELGYDAIEESAVMNFNSPKENQK